MADHSYLMRVGLFASFIVLGALLVIVSGAPQLFNERSREPFVVSEAVDVVDAEPLVRSRRGSDIGEHDLLSRGSHGYGHGGGYGGGHGHGHGHGGGGHYGGWGAVGPVFTYARTDYHGNFQWGVRHKVGGGHGHHGK